jgi:hypothetical protein
MSTPVQDKDNADDLQPEFPQRVRQRLRPTTPQQPTPAPDSASPPPTPAPSLAQSGVAQSREAPAPRIPRSPQLWPRSADTVPPMPPAPETVERRKPNVESATALSDTEEAPRMPRGGPNIAAPRGRNRRQLVGESSPVRR